LNGRRSLQLRKHLPLVEILSNKKKKNLGVHKDGKNKTYGRNKISFPRLFSSLSNPLQVNINVPNIVLLLMLEK